MLQILEPTPRKPQGIALLRLGFRPLYLCCSLLATVVVPLRAAVFTGNVYWPAYTRWRLVPPVARSSA